MPKVNQNLLKFEGFQYDTSLDLNMVYYHILITEDASDLCAVILPWEKFGYKRLTMRVGNSLDILQQKINGLF